MERSPRSKPGAEAIAVATDLSQEDDLQRLVQSAVDRFGGVDILVNNAAVTIGHSWAVPIVEMPRADWLYHFAVNLHAPFTLVQLVVPIMEKRGGGRILNVTTGSGEVFRQPEEPPALESVAEFSLESPAYFASKRALDRFANVISAQLARKNIAIITMHPGFVASEIAVHRVQGMGVPESMMIPMGVPARMLAYFAACEGHWSIRVNLLGRTRTREVGIEPEPIEARSGFVGGQASSPSRRKVSFVRDIVSITN